MAKNIKIMAVAGALGLAALPMAGVFAETGDTKNIVDNIKVIVEESCNFTGETIRYRAATQDDVDNDRAENVGDDVIDTYGSDFEGSALPGAVVDLNGATNGEDAVRNFTVRCNKDGGYTVTAKATGLAREEDDSDPRTIPYQMVGTYNKTTKTSVMGAWNVAISTSVANAETQAAYDAMNETAQADVDYIYNNGVSESGATIITKKSSTGNSGTGFTATYSAYVGVDTPTGTYTGTVEYTLIPAA